MAYKHGIYSNEVETSLTAPANVDSGILIAIGTAPLHMAAAPADIYKPVLASTYSEAVNQLGYSADFEKYTLCEVMQSQFSLYNVSPVVFINVLDPTKHFTEVTVEKGGVANTAPQIADDLDSSSIVVSSGSITPPTVFEAADYAVEPDEEMENFIITIKSSGKVEDNKINVSYTTNEGDAVTSDIALTSSMKFLLPFEIDSDSILIQSGGSDTYAELVNGTDYEIEYSAGLLTINLLTSTKIVDDTVFIKYHRISPEKVTAADIVGGVDASGRSSGLEIVEGVYGRFNLVPGILIAPKYSQNLQVMNALTAKAKSVSGMFGALAIADLDSEICPTYTAAVEYKLNKLISDPHLVVCWPKVSSGGVQYHMSTQLAGLLNRIDTENGDIPYVSPSNKTLQIDSAILGDGTEIYLTRDQANFLNQNGIGTALSFSGWKFWGNRTSAYPASNDPRENFIPIRRMFNFINATFITSYLANLDMPLNRRMIDSVVNSANIYLNGLVNRGCLIGGRLEFNEADNATADLMDGVLKFHLHITPPSPARSLTFEIEYDPSYLESLFA